MPDPRTSTELLDDLRRLKLPISLQSASDVPELVAVWTKRLASRAHVEMLHLCSDCYARLTATRVTLEKIGPLVGIGACSSEVNH